VRVEIFRTLTATLITCKCESGGSVSQPISFSGLPRLPKLWVMTGYVVLEINLKSALIWCSEKRLLVSEYQCVRIFCPCKTVGLHNTFLISRPEVQLK
jgi:hypothetical protein